MERFQVSLVASGVAVYTGPFPAAETLAIQEDFEVISNATITTVLQGSIDGSEWVDIETLQSAVNYGSGHSSLFTSRDNATKPTPPLLRLKITCTSTGNLNVLIKRRGRARPGAPRVLFDGMVPSGGVYSKLCDAGSASGVALVAIMVPVAGTGTVDAAIQTSQDGENFVNLAASSEISAGQPPYRASGAVYGYADLSRAQGPIGRVRLVSNTAGDLAHVTLYAVPWSKGRGVSSAARPAGGGCGCGRSPGGPPPPPPPPHKYVGVGSADDGGAGGGGTAVTPGGGGHIGHGPANIIHCKEMYTGSDLNNCEKSMERAWNYEQCLCRNPPNGPGRQIDWEENVNFGVYGMNGCAMEWLVGNKQGNTGYHTCGELGACAASKPGWQGGAGFNDAAILNTCAAELAIRLRNIRQGHGDVITVL